MSDQQLQAFWDAIQADSALQQKLQGVTDPEAIAAIAQDAGFVISADEFRNAQAQLSEEDLVAVAGGACCAYSAVPSNPIAPGLPY